MHSLRKFVGRGSTALAIAALVALAVSVQAGQAARSSRSIALTSSVQPQAHELSGTLPSHVASVALSPQCLAAWTALKNALAADRAEDNLENANASADTETGADATEDANEAAALKPLITAVAGACGGTLHQKTSPPVPKTPACANALAALKNAMAQDRTEDQAELANGTEGTAADQAEDESEMAARMPLWSAVRTACAGQFTTFTWQHH